MWKALIATFLLLFVGCEIIAPISGIVSVGVFWMNREAHKYYNTEFDDMERSVKSALIELEMPIEEEYYSGDTLILKCDVNDRFKISLNPVRENVTKVSILVDLLGDKPYAEMIYRHIDGQDGVVQFATVEELNCTMDESPRKK